jgi:anti-anti-sigma regulatory factor
MPDRPDDPIGNRPDAPRPAAHRVAQADPAVLDIGLAAVTFLDCAGIGMFVAARNAAVHAGGHVLVSLPRPPSDGS